MGLIHLILCYQLYYKIYKALNYRIRLISLTSTLMLRKCLIRINHFRKDSSNRFVNMAHYLLGTSGQQHYLDYYYLLGLSRTFLFIGIDPTQWLECCEVKLTELQWCKTNQTKTGCGLLREGLKLSCDYYRSYSLKHVSCYGLPWLRGHGLNQWTIGRGLKENPRQLDGAFQLQVLFV